MIMICMEEQNVSLEENNPKMGEVLFRQCCEDVPRDTVGGAIVGQESMTSIPIQNQC